MWLELLLLLLIAGLMLLLLLAGLMLLQCCCEVRRDWISERMRKLRELVPNMDKGYEAQFAEEKQRNFKLMRNLNFIEESGSEPYT
ncbi:Kinesin-like protein KIN-13A [Camellia lanceoleosa]|uniref:Kinesin-like protein KIN-13A n=1 Tax=Camellia lanceoleosa TaxID=1840588 RepID=A0ACC0F3X3_9ERIC|nr:Kinesin-like protein KIN-13A [Camellia lanceoleosa]